MSLLVTNPNGTASTVQVNILRGATLLGADGSSLSLNNSFSVGDTVELRGSYEGATFNASIIIKEAT